MINMNQRILMKKTEIDNLTDHEKHVLISEYNTEISILEEEIATYSNDNEFEGIVMPKRANIRYLQQKIQYIKQTMCTHPETYEEESMSLYNNTVKIYCRDCHKLIRKEQRGIKKEVDPFL